MSDKKLEKLIAIREGKSLVGNILTAMAKEIVHTADDIISIDDADDRREAWGEFLDELGMPSKDF